VVVVVVVVVVVAVVAVVVVAAVCLMATAMLWHCGAGKGRRSDFAVPP
jgi:hypothetical protein